MTCFSPMIREFSCYEKTENGKTKTLSIFKLPEGETYEYYTDINAKKQIVTGKGYQLIPCGNCIGCRIDYSREWAKRCVLEAKGYEDGECWFLTLTYDDEHKPQSYDTNNLEGKYINKSTAEIKDEPDKKGDQIIHINGYLEPKHLQKFFKDLRRYYEYHYDIKGIRFYACGEYGDRTQRPHYHALVFGMPIPTNKLNWYKRNELGDPLYYSKELTEIWGRGFVTIGELNYHTAAYVARYCTKKINGASKENGFYEKQGKTPEFSRMSRRPGIGERYYRENREEIYKNDEIIMKTVKDMVIGERPPRYYDRLYDVDSPEDMELLKRKRKQAAEEAERLERWKSTLTKEERLKVKENSMRDKFKLHVRGLD